MADLIIKTGMVLRAAEPGRYYQFVPSQMSPIAPGHPIESLCPDEYTIIIGWVSYEKGLYDYRCWMSHPLMKKSHKSRYISGASLTTLREEMAAGHLIITRQPGQRRL